MLEIEFCQVVSSLHEISNTNALVEISQACFLIFETVSSTNSFAERCMIIWKYRVMLLGEVCDKMCNGIDKYSITLD